MIEVYRTDNTEYEKNGDMPLLPIKARVNVELNGTWVLELGHPIDDEGRWKYLEEEAVVKCSSFNGDQLFRIKSIEKNDDSALVKAYPIFYDSKNDCFLTDIRPTVKNGQDALNIMLAPNKKYSAQSDIARKATAYYEYMNLMEAINGDNANSFLNRWGGEILYDNFKIIVNERVGGDYGVELRYGKNIPVNGITETVDMSEVVTRIYPKSYNGYKLSGNGYVDSPILSNYPTVKAATMKFDNIKMREDAQEDDEENGVTICSTQEELDAALTRECQKQFEAGLDKPKVTIEADMVLLQNTDQYKDYEILETVSLGDTIHCLHNKLGIETDARVIELEYDCLTKRVVSVVLGDFKQNYLDKAAGTVDKIESVLTPDGGLMADKVEGFLNAIKTQIRYQKSVVKKQDVRAILFEDLDPESPLYGALCMGTLGFQISKRRTADGRDWDWTTAFNANGGYADIIIAGVLSDKTGQNFWNLDTGEMQLSARTIIDGKLLGDAVKAATDFMKFGPDGLQIGNNQAGTWAGYRIRIAGNGTEILDDSGTVVASYQVSEVELGKNSINTIIRLCGSKAILWYNAVEDFFQFESKRLRNRATDLASLYAINGKERSGYNAYTDHLEMYAYNAQDTGSQFLMNDKKAELYVKDKYLISAPNGIDFNPDKSKVLYEGVAWLDSGTINFPIPASSFMTGIVLVFSLNEDGFEQDWAYSSHFIPKYLLQDIGEKPYSFILSAETFNITGVKFCYISNTRIVGHASNNGHGTKNGITYDNRRWALRRVYGV